MISQHSPPTDHKKVVTDVSASIANGHPLRDSRFASIADLTKSPRFLLGDPKPSNRADGIGRKDKQMFNSYVGVYDPEREETEVFAGFWSTSHAMDYVYQIDQNITGNGQRDDRIMFLFDLDGVKTKVYFYGAVNLDDRRSPVKTWQKFDDAQVFSPYMKQIIPLKNYGASKKHVTEVIRNAVIAEIRQNASTLD